MVGDGKILETAPPGPTDHVFQAAATITGIGVDVKITLQILQGYQARQLFLAGRLDLSTSFPQLGGYERQTDSPKHGCLSLAGHPFLPFEHSVLVDLEPTLLSQATKLNIVGLASREIVECRAEALAGHDPKVDLKTAAQDDGGTCVSLGDDLVHLVVTCKALHDGFGRLGGD